MITFKEKPNTEKEVLDLLTPLVKEWFTNKFKNFVLPQLYSVIEIHSRNNILVSSPTGSGKTLTAMLAILNELVDSSQKGILEDKIYCVYSSPLKALSRDIHKNLIEPLEEIEKILGKKTGIRIMIRTGDTTQAEKAKMLKQTPHIIITTPESLSILLASQKFSDKLKDVQWVILDEIHSLCENKRGVHLSLSLERLHQLSPGLCRIGLSATVAPLEEIAKFLVGYGRPCIIVDVQHIKKHDFEVISPVTDLVNCSYEDISRETYNLLDKLIHEHKTTLIFTNTRSGTERVVHHLKYKFPKKYIEINEQGEATGSLIAAHHGSLSKSHRFEIEDALKEGKLKCVVTSTSLELGIDIGSIDLVICLGSPKSVARFVQRAGRSNHQLDKTTKAKVIVQGRDDLIECSVLVKAAIEHKIDKVHIPTNCLDVLAQQINGFAIADIFEENELFKVIKKSYCYKDLKREEFDEILSYLAGEFASLEDRYVYAKIWRNEGKIGKRGRLGRVIYMTNIGTIPDQTFVIVKIGDRAIGHIDENFLERLKPGDIFVLGGDTYEFRHARGMVAQVKAAIGKSPTIPSWFSEMLPLSYDLALQIQRFRKLLREKFHNGVKKEDSIDFIKNYLYLKEQTAEAIYNYFKEQFEFMEIPDLDNILVETYKDEHEKTYVIFHTLYGSRVNDVLSRALAFSIAKTQGRDVEIGVNDNGFYVMGLKRFNALTAFNLVKSDNLKKVLEISLEKSEVLKRIENKEIKIIENSTLIPSPFAVNLVIEGYSDILKIEEKHEFLKRMHSLVQAKISLKK